jgi:hypothetical protein
MTGRYVELLRRARAATPQQIQASIQAAIDVKLMREQRELGYQGVPPRPGLWEDREDVGV